MWPRDCLHETRKGLKRHGTIFAPPLYEDFFKRDGIHKCDEMSHLPKRGI